MGILQLGEWNTAAVMTTEWGAFDADGPAGQGEGTLRITHYNNGDPVVEGELTFDGGDPRSFRACVAPELVDAWNDAAVRALVGR